MRGVNRESAAGAKVASGRQDTGGCRGWRTLRCL